jgi:hypothetical protein
VVVKAGSKEKLVSIAASAAGGGDAGVAIAASVYILKIDTYAYVEDATSSDQGASITAGDSVAISAEDATDLVMVAGNLAFSGSASVGAAGAVPVITKNTQAYIGKYATVIGRGLLDGVAVNTGGFTISHPVLTTEFSINLSNVTANSITFGSNHGWQTGQPVQYFKGSGDAIGGLTDGRTYYVVVVNPTTIQLATRRDLAKQGIADITLDASQATGTGHKLVMADTLKAPEMSVESQYSEKLSTNTALNTVRKTDPALPNAFKGVAVIALNQDKVTSAAVSGGVSGSVAVNLGGSVYILTTTTKAFVNENASVNPNNTADDEEQSVLISAGNDFYHLGIAGGLAISGSASGMPSIQLQKPISMTALPSTHVMMYMCGLLRVKSSF